MPSIDPNKLAGNWIYDFATCVMCIWFPITGFLVSCHYILFPDWPIYFTSFLSKEDLTFWKLLPMGLVWFSILQTGWMNLLAMAIIMQTYVIYFNRIQLEYNCSNNAAWSQCGGGGFMSQTTVSVFREFGTLQKYYRQLEVVNVIFMDAFSIVIVPTLSVITNLALFCNYSMIRYGETMNIANFIILGAWSGISTLAIVIALTFGGSIYNDGNKVLRSMKNKDWDSKARNKEMKRFVRSCRPIYLGYGTMYRARKTSVLRFLQGINRGTFRAVLTI